MPRFEFVSFILACQIVAGIMLGSAFAFGQIYGRAGVALHMGTMALALVIYSCISIAAAQRHGAQSAAGSLRNGMIATLFFCVIGSAILAAGPAALQVQLHPYHMVKAVFPA